MSYRLSSDFVDRSNKRAKDKRYCAKHLTAYWGKDLNGNYYERCSAGHRLNESCEVGK